jgi:hypothetical protein
MGKSLALILVFGSLQGCTVLGLAGDLALNSLSEKTKNDSDKNGLIEPYFTKLGVEHDVKIVSQLLASTAAKTSPLLEETLLFPASYANKSLCEKGNSLVTECFDSAYYQAIYEEAKN